MRKPTVREIARTPMSAGTWVEAYTENNREIRTDGNLYWVQPYNDNYWIATRSPGAALRAYYHPEKY